jgi:hypothetical protein
MKIALLVIFPKFWAIFFTKVFVASPKIESGGKQQNPREVKFGNFFSKRDQNNNDLGQDHDRRFIDQAHREELRFAAEIRKKGGRISGRAFCDKTECHNFRTRKAA